MKDPNNLRNRYRRAMDARRAYGWQIKPFRCCVRYLQDHPNSYAAEPHHANYAVNLCGPSGNRKPTP
jgi:hypothetical protein